MLFIDKLKKIIKKYKNLGNKLENTCTISSQNFSNITKEYSYLIKINIYSIAYLKNFELLKEAEKIFLNNQDETLNILALDQKKTSKANIKNFKKKIELILISKDAIDIKEAIIEIRAGTGGNEAALFANTLFKMYRKYAANQNWKFELLSTSEIILQGSKEITASVSGKGVYKKLKYESGVHRVQRIPKTETNGRIHTSTATVAVLPKDDNINFKINEKDLKIDSYRSSGAGGQHVNTTDSAIRITHLPTGIVTVQSEKSQHQNKIKALKILQSKLLFKEKEKQNKKISNLRKSQVGTGDRAERIRTYNFLQNRITDHRINLTTYNLEETLQEAKIDQFINILIEKNSIKTTFKKEK